MQKSTDKQIDDKITGKIDQNVSKTVRTILSNDPIPNAFKANKKSQQSKNTFCSTDGGVNTANTGNENENADERNHRLFLSRHSKCAYKWSYFQYWKRPEKANYTGIEGVDVFQQGFKRHSGIFDAYCMDTAPRRCFEKFHT